jgi:hypothetical protein
MVSPAYRGLERVPLIVRFWSSVVPPEGTVPWVMPRLSVTAVTSALAAGRPEDRILVIFNRLYAESVEACNRKIKPVFANLHNIRKLWRLLKPSKTQAIHGTIVL